MPSAKQVARDKQNFDKFRSEKMYRSAEYNQLILNRMLGALAGGLAAVAVALVLFLPAALGYVAYRATRDQLARRDYGIILAADVLIALMWWPAGLDRYLLWIWDIGPGTGSPWAVPVVPILLLAVATATATGVLVGTRVLGLVPFIRNRNIAPGDSLVPDDNERARINTVAAPPSHTQVDPTTTTLGAADTGVLGKRELPIGMTRNGTPYAVTEKELGTHAVMLGATGSGKTESIKTVASRLLDLGWDGVLIDLKEDTAPGGLRDFCRTYASARQAPYQEVCLSDPDSPYWFNSLYGLGPDEARDAIISMQDFEAPHWAEVGKRLIGQLVTLMYDAHKVDPHRFAYPDIYTMGQIFSKGGGIPQATKAMRAIVQEALPARTDDDFHMLANPDDLAKTAAPGLGNRLTSIYETQAGRQTLRAANPRHPAMDVAADGLSYLGLNSLGLPQLSRAISSSALLRLAAYAGQRTQAAKPRPKFIIIDEANFLDTEITLNILSRARSAGIATILCSQSPKDFDREVRKGKPGFAQLAQNINVAVVMRQGEPESAEVAADYLGKHKVMQQSERMVDGEGTGEGTSMLREEHKVTPQQLMELRVGEAIIKVGVPEPRIDWVKVALTEL